MTTWTTTTEESTTWTDVTEQSTTWTVVAENQEIVNGFRNWNIY